jgi:hypothetical protein
LPEAISTRLVVKCLTRFLQLPMLRLLSPHGTIALTGCQIILSIKPVNAGRHDSAIPCFSLLQLQRVLAPYHFLASNILETRAKPVAWLASASTQAMNAGSSVPTSSKNRDDKKLKKKKMKETAPSPSQEFGPLPRNPGLDSGDKKKVMKDKNAEPTKQLQPPKKKIRLDEKEDDGALCDHTAYRISHDEVKGRILIATRDIEIGEVILEEEPLVCASSFEHRCLECHQNHDPASCAKACEAFSPKVAKVSPASES